MNDANIPPADPTNMDMPVMVRSDNASGGDVSYPPQNSVALNATHTMNIMVDIRVKNTNTYVIILYAFTPFSLFSLSMKR